MFLNLRQNSPFYILDKNKLDIKICQVVNVTNPLPRFNNNFCNNYNDTIVDITVKDDDLQYKFDKVPSNSIIANFNEGLVISEDKSAILSELESMINNSKKVIDSVDTHLNILNKCNDMILMLNPLIAKDKENEIKINNLESLMNDVKSTLSDMKDMLSKALNLNT